MEKVKDFYDEPVIEVVSFDTFDVLTTSNMLEPDL